jgi:hypothetical protein
MRKRVGVAARIGILMHFRKYENSGASLWDKLNETIGEYYFLSEVEQNVL